MPTPKCPFSPAAALPVGSRWICANFHTHTPGSSDYAKSQRPAPDGLAAPKLLPLLLITMLVLALSCTPKDRRNRMTWVKPGNGHVLKDPALAAKLKNLPTEIVDSGFKYIIFQTTIDYFLCNASYYCSKSYEKKDGDRQGVVGRAFLIISPVEKEPAMKPVPKQGDNQPTVGRISKLKDVSIVKISIILDDYIYQSNPEKCNLLEEASGDGDGFGSIRFITPVGPLWEDWGAKRMAFFVVDFRIGRELHSIRSEPLPIHSRR